VSTVREFATVVGKVISALADSEFSRREALKILTHGVTRPPRRFIVTSKFLRRAYPHLMARPQESLIYVTGSEMGNVAVLDELVIFKLAVQEMAYVRGDFVSSTAALIDMGDRGYRLNGTLHCHPGGGACATFPSGIDMAHHERLERGGYKAVGIIMTRDGHFRFYTYRMPFIVEVFGDDVERLGGNSFRLDLDSGCDNSKDPVETKTEEMETREEKKGRYEKERCLNTGEEQVSEAARTADFECRRVRGIRNGSTGESPWL